MIRYFDLQLFSEEKTEQPTPKKLREAREKGQIAQSKEFNGAASLLAVFFAFSMMSGFYIENLGGYFVRVIEQIPQAESLYSSETVHAFFGDALMFILRVSLPLLAIALLTGLVASYAQVGFLFTLEPIKPKFSKLDPIKGLKNVISSRALIELFKSVFKAVLILFVAVDVVRGRLTEISYALQMDLTQIVVLMWSIIYNIVIRCSVVLFLIAVIDYEFKRRKNKKELMMTKQEIKQEYKQSEGDPQLKGKIKEKQRAISMSRMMQQVPKADVIITNPTHYAVAIKYDPALGDAPIVIAKGQDLVAQNIKRVAEEHKVPLVENKEIARAMYFTLEIGERIPPELYEAVAEILAYVYSLKKAEMR